MKTLSVEYVKKMKAFIGKAIIRINPTSQGEYCFIEKVVFLNSIEPRKMIISWDYNGTKTFSFSSSYLDENWLPLDEVLKSPHPEYTAFEGKYVKRKVESLVFDPSYTRNEFDEGNKYKMMTATATHLFINRIDEKGQETSLIIHTSRDAGKNWVLDPEYS